LPRILGPFYPRADRNSARENGKQTGGSISRRIRPGGAVAMMFLPRTSTLAGVWQPEAAPRFATPALLPEFRPGDPGTRSADRLWAQPRWSSLSLGRQSRSEFSRNLRAPGLHGGYNVRCSSVNERTARRFIEGAGPVLAALSAASLTPPRAWSPHHAGRAAAENDWARGRSGQRLPLRSRDRLSPRQARRGTRPMSVGRRLTLIPVERCFRCCRAVQRGQAVARSCLAQARRRSR
jgi:hypothetical protein